MSALRRGGVTLILGIVLVVLLVSIAGLTLTRDNGAEELKSAAMPWRSSDDLTGDHREVAEAAEKEALAFLKVDYTDMDTVMDRVLAGATGDFKKQYAEKRDLLKEEAIKNESKSNGSVVALGIGELDEDSALVFVAADTTVSNKFTEGTEQPRYYRLQLDLVREGGKWLTSNVQFVG